MKGSVIALGQIGEQKAAAHIVDGKLEDFLIDPVDDGPLRPGSICRAVCDRMLKGQGGMMMRLPEGQTGFLRQGQGLRPGQGLLVQVTGNAEGGKAIPVTQRILFKSRFAIVTPGAPGINISRSIKDEETRVVLREIAEDVFGDEKMAGLIIRSAAADADPDAVADDIRTTLGLNTAIMNEPADGVPELLLDGPDAHELAWREWPAADIYAEGATAFADHGVEDLIDNLKRPRVELPGQGFAFIEPTHALVAIDVNTGGDTSAAAALKANIALARVLPRELRCRGLGGQIVIDFAPMPKKDRRQLEQTLRSALKGDSVETSLVGWTTLGLFELQRKRERLPTAGQLPK